MSTSETPTESTKYFVLVWDFELDESGQVVKDGAVFTELKAAQTREKHVLIAALNYDFASRVEPVVSRRLKQSGYVVGLPVVRALNAGDVSSALADALDGKGQEVTE